MGLNVTAANHVIHYSRNTTILNGLVLLLKNPQKTFCRHFLNNVVFWEQMVFISQIIVIFADRNDYLNNISMEKIVVNDKDYTKLVSKAVKFFWNTKKRQLKDSGDASNRDAVVGGKQMDGFSCGLAMLILTAIYLPKSLFRVLLTRSLVILVA